MRLLAASDMHGDMSAVRQLAEKADKYDVDAVVLCGDLSHFGDIPKGVIGPFVKPGRKIMFVMGNHDSPALGEFLGRKYSIANLQGYSLVVGDVGFFGCGGTDIPINFLPEKEMESYLRHGWKAVRSAPKKVMITHMHPESGDVEKAVGIRGSKAVRKAIEKFQPDLHLHGHIHETEGYEAFFGKTLSVCLGPKGRVFEI